MGEKQTAHFLVQKLSFSERDKYKTFLMKMSYICLRIKNYFHFNGFAPSPTLKQRREATWKWPIGFHVFPDFSIIRIQILQTDLYIFPQRVT